MNRRNSIVTGLAVLSSAAGMKSTAQAAEAKSKNPELEKIRALLKAHDQALASHNLAGVLAVLSPNAVIMGTGPGEVWSGTEEIKDAYTHFFADFDKGKQDFTYNVRFGELSPVMGWLLVSGEVKSKKDGRKISFPLNISITASKAGGDWKIAAMHFSTLTDGKSA